MGMFDTVFVENTILLKNNTIPILPLNYQTKDLDCNLKVYPLEEVLQKFKIKELKIYTVFNQDFFSELLEDEDLEKDLLFSVDHFSKAVASNWLEYHLKISRKKIIDINIKSYRY